MPRKPSLDGKDSSLRIRMSPEQKEKLVSMQSDIIRL